ncbi:type I secretion system permease/ATPase [Chelativorans sp. Marseille-P2723]|uniref:type I secretion system permease/ATPase n=1 Tax=Chelativorans sp. Marseille-P2723 TaxID=2709133 RepID=UPI001570ABC7|nr:type I secretion system permease/ATPase [Chelativorans sp. Marseille-P2723]
MLTKGSQNKPFGEPPQAGRPNEVQGGADKCLADIDAAVRDLKTLAAYEGLTPKGLANTNGQASPAGARETSGRSTTPSAQSRARLENSFQPQPITAEPRSPVAEPQAREESAPPRSRTEVKIGPVIEGDTGLLAPHKKADSSGGGSGAKSSPPNGGGGGGGAPVPGSFPKRVEMPDFAVAFKNGLDAVRKNIAIVMVFTIMTNILVLAIPIYLFQIADRVLTSRSVDTLVMLTVVVAAAVILQMAFDAIRRFILMRTAVEIGAQLGAPVLAAAARSSLNGSARDYHVLGDLQQIRSFITSGTLLSILDVPIAPLFVLVVFLIHPHLGSIVVGASLLLIFTAYVNQRMTAQHFSDANGFNSRATLHVDSMSRNSQIINAMAMIPEAVRMWGRDTALALRSQVRAQDRNIVISSASKSLRLLTQVAMLGWGAFLAIKGEMTGGMVIAASIIASRALTPIEGAIEGWSGFTQYLASFQRVRALLQTSPLNFQRLLLPTPQGRLDVDRILYVPPPTKKVILNGISFSLLPGETLAVIGNSGSGKTTLGKMLVGSILPTSGNVRLDLMDLRNWDQRQFGENIGYLPQDVQLFPGSIKANIARMRDDATDQQIFDAAILADVHELIASFPQGYETFVAADGAPLSGGQKQRIALARAFFGSPRLVVLDEPNSNLDSPGEIALAKALLHARKQKITVVTITQRTALLNHVDKILVLNNGSVAMFGSRNEILKTLANKSRNTGLGGMIDNSGTGP